MGEIRAVSSHRGILSPVLDTGGQGVLLGWSDLLEFLRGGNTRASGRETGRFRRPGSAGEGLRCREHSWSLAGVLGLVGERQLAGEELGSIIVRTSRFLLNTLEGQGRFLSTRVTPAALSFLFYMRRMTRTQLRLEVGRLTWRVCVGALSKGRWWPGPGWWQLGLGQEWTHAKDIQELGHAELAS